MYDLKGKNAIVTGGAIGIGFYCCNEFLKLGANKCVILDIDSDLGLKAEKKLCSEYGKDRALFVKCDVKQRIEFEKAMEMAMGYMKSCDILINNAGIFNENDWENLIQINLGGVIRGVHLGIKYMGKNNGGQGGAIVNMSSVMGVDVAPFCATYCAAKHGINAITRCYGLPYHLEKTGIRVMAMCPGATNTALAANAPKSQMDDDMNKQCEKLLKSLPKQEPSQVSEGVVHMLQYGNSGSLWISEGDELYEVDIPEKTKMRKIQ